MKDGSVVNRGREKRQRSRPQSTKAPRAKNPTYSPIPSTCSGGVARASYANSASEIQNKNEPSWEIITHLSVTISLTPTASKMASLRKKKKKTLHLLLQSTRPHQFPYPFPDLHRHHRNMTHLKGNEARKVQTRQKKGKKQNYQDDCRASREQAHSKKTKDLKFLPNMKSVEETDVEKLKISQM